MKKYVAFEGMTWPTAEEETEWRLRHAPESVTREDQLYAASIISAYRQMIWDPQTKRTRVIRELRAASRR